ncbi:MAG: periplasmic heavy metal sensor [Kiritimatiellae bacterium]|nr:periplasmic heavy metal sensor [Kiritimatiellia bacterium]
MNRKLVVFLLPCILVCSLFAQPPKGRFPAHRSPHFANWVGKCVVSEQFIRDAEISAEQAQTLRDALDKISTRQQAIETNITELAQRQGKLGENILNQKGVDPAPLYEIAEQIAELRGEQAKLAIQTLVAIRETLTDEQRQKVSSLLREEGKRRQQEWQSLRKNREERDSQRARRRPPFAPPPPPPKEGN